jgi:hypothetical protein
MRIRSRGTAAIGMWARLRSDSYFEALCVGTAKCKIMSHPGSSMELTKLWPSRDTRTSLLAPLDVGVST